MVYAADCDLDLDALQGQADEVLGMGIQRVSGETTRRRIEHELEIGLVAPQFDELAAIFGGVAMGIFGMSICMGG